MGWWEESSLNSLAAGKGVPIAAPAGDLVLGLLPRMQGMALLPLLPFSPSSRARALLDLEESCQGSRSPAVLGSGRDFKGLLSWDPKLLPIEAHVGHQVTLRVVLSAIPPLPQPAFAGWCVTFTHPLSTM